MERMNQALRLFMTGTDTEVGKTMVTAALAAAMRKEGIPVKAIKPMATGGASPGEDAELIARAAGHPPLNLISLPVPASPERAAIEAQQTLSFSDILTWIQTHEGPVLVEGVGGWEVPITQEHRVSDLAEALQLPVVLVAANRLGVLNHTLMTVDAIHRRGLPIAAVVLNEVHSTQTSLSKWNLDDLQRHVSMPVIPFPHQSNDDLASAGAALLAVLQ